MASRFAIARYSAAVALAGLALLFAAPIAAAAPPPPPPAPEDMSPLTGSQATGSAQILATGMGALTGTGCAYMQGAGSVAPAAAPVAGAKTPLALGK